MTWWVTLLEWVGITVVIITLTAGLYTILGFITEKILKRRYKEEDDKGRPRQEFERSIADSGRIPGVRMEHKDSEHEPISDIPAETVRADEQDVRDDRKESRLHSNDYERFKKEFLE